jgi:hypothetical protein
LGPVERNAVTGVGAPWYTSGAQIWNGAADTLNPHERQRRSQTQEAQPQEALDSL